MLRGIYTPKILSNISSELGQSRLKTTVNVVTLEVQPIYQVLENYDGSTVMVHDGLHVCRNGGIAALME